MSLRDCDSLGETTVPFIISFFKNHLNYYIPDSKKYTLMALKALNFLGRGITVTASKLVIKKPKDKNIIELSLFYI